MGRCSEQPNIGFLLKHAEVAFNAWLAAATVKPVQRVAKPKPPAGLQLIASPKPEDKPATKPEVFAILGMKLKEDWRYALIRMRGV